MTKKEQPLRLPQPTLHSAGIYLFFQRSEESGKSRTTSASMPSHMDIWRILSHIIADLICRAVSLIPVSSFLLLHSMLSVICMCFLITLPIITGSLGKC